MSNMDTLQQDLARLNKLARLSAAADNVDKIIDMLVTAREQIAADAQAASITMAKLQNPVKEGLEAVNDSLREVSKGHKNLGRALDKSFPLQALPTDHDAMAEHPSLINRAIAMHLVREGQFSVASAFIEEAQQDNPPQNPHLSVSPSSSHYQTEDTPSVGLDVPMDEDDRESETYTTASTGEHQDLSSLQSHQLRLKFAEMYKILQELRARNLVPAIQWARANSEELEARGSNLEFELSKLQYVWLFKGPAVNGLPDDANNGLAGALAYSKRNFGRFQARHLREIQQLASAMAFASNLGESPYGSIFATDSSFSEVATSFTREFCSLLGLSAESPLYIAATAGALALPRLMKFITRAKGTEWTTDNELAFETPLPERMIYHSIFVCPVSKEQTTEDNPPMIIPCGHVLARQTLQKLCKNQRFKCPYCPSEGQFKDARQIIL